MSSKKLRRQVVADMQHEFYMELDGKSNMFIKTDIEKVALIR